MEVRGGKPQSVRLVFGQVGGQPVEAGQHGARQFDALGAGARILPLGFHG